MIKDALNHRAYWNDYINGKKKPSGLFEKILKKRLALAFSQGIYA